MSSLGPDLGSEHGDQTVLRHVLALIAEEGVGDRQALEFGVGSGTTLATIAAVLPVTGWDSFEGLPENWRPGFERGMFAVSKIPQAENATVVVGLFEDTLPAYDWFPDIALFHVDCDLASSTRTVLRYAGHLLQAGTWIVFDEFFGYEGCEDHEQLAWTEWLAEHPDVTYEVVGHGREQVAFHITSVGPA